jgi:phosphatidylserine decarboxylase
VINRFKVLPQYLIPKQAITILAGKVASAKAGKLTTAIIAWFVKHYQVNMSEAAEPNIQAYDSFNEFFTRPLKKGVRPINKADFISPVDGAISQFGSIKADQIFQAKGHHYSTLALLAGNKTLADHFLNGLRNFILKSKRLSSHSHAMRWQNKKHDLCSWRFIFG